MKDLRPNHRRAKTAITLIWIVFALEIASFISGYLQYNLLQNVASGYELSTEAANANDLREQFVAILYLAAFIISAVTFIQWFRRAYYNLHSLANDLTYSEGWAAGSWFVPIVNLFRPYQIMKELYQVTKELLAKKEDRFGSNLPIGLLGWWWTLWIINNVIGNFLLRYSLSAETVDQLINSTIASMVGNIIGIVLALVTIKMIKNYSNAEPFLVGLKEEGNESGHQEF